MSEIKAWKKAWKDAPGATALQGISGLASLGTNLYSMYNNDTSGMEAQIEAERNAINSMLGQKISAGSIEDLIAQEKMYTPLSTDYSASDFNVTKTNGELASGTLSGAAAGASAGSVLGPLGTAIGGIVGGLGSLASGLFGNSEAERKAEEEAERLRREALAANNYQEAKFDLAANNINMNNYRDNLINNIAAFGGLLSTNGSNWTNGLTFINEGGSHEENPYGGVPVGIAQDGQSNLVEEGEVLWNDYVFSNRIEVPEPVLKKYKLGRKDMTFAEAVKKAQEQAELRPNDPIERRGLNALLNSLMQEQEIIRQREAEYTQYDQAEAAYAAMGGKIRIAENKKGTFTAAAKKAGMGVQEFANHVLSNKDKYTPAMRKKANFARNASKWHALGGHLFLGGGDKNPITNMYYEDVELPFTFDVDKRYNPFIIKNNNKQVSTDFPSEDSSIPQVKWTDPSYLRYAPIFGSGISAIASLFDKPNRSYGKTVRNAGRSIANSLQPVSYKPMGTRMAYNPMDRMYYANQLGAQAAANRNAILANSSNNRGATINALLAADYNATQGLGNLFRQSEEMNRDQRQKVTAFELGREQANSTMGLDVAKTNAGIRQAQANMLWDATNRGLAFDMGEDAAIQANRNTALSGLFNNLGSFGKESWIFNMIKNNPDLMYYYLNNGAMKYNG